MPSNEFSQGRRQLLGMGTGLLVSAPAAFAKDEIVQEPVTATVVRIASVSTDVEGGLLPALLESFRAETQTGFTLTHGNDPYGAATRGEADLVISHYGHHDTERFVLQGLGQWPRTVFSNQAALIGPSSDPAKVKGLTSLVAAFRRIAESGSPYVVNNGAGTRYLTQIVWNAAGRPPLGAWFVDGGNSGGNALASAAQKEAYMLWGLTPFLREQQKQALALEPLVLADPLLQRLMVAVAVNPERTKGINAGGAHMLIDYLLQPQTQARILTTPYASASQALWSPAGRHNAGAVLPN